MSVILESVWVVTNVGGIVEPTFVEDGLEFHRLTFGRERPIKYFKSSSPEF
jgi:hypothetical protein